jgi:[glutamine synthetase] adenylyltransferase / [glutamine synthetase]-adenylyl-L-tyrosine phosphorylase
VNAVTRNKREGFWGGRFMTMTGIMTRTEATDPVANHSRFVQRLRRRYPDLLALLPHGPIDRAQLVAGFAALLERGLDKGAALRVLRQLVMERLIRGDCTSDAAHRLPLQTVTSAVTDLAEFALDIACSDAFEALDAVHGAPIAAAPPNGLASTFRPKTADSPAATTIRPAERAELWVVGMGKLGARELNVSSDIDLIYVYDQDGETSGTPEGRGRISNHEYFAKAVKRIFAMVGETTEHGFVFRLDLALRPNGNSGPPAVSMGALEDYLQVQGREWERFAWLKSRVVAPRSSVLSGSARASRCSASSVDRVRSSGN